MVPTYTAWETQPVVSRVWVPLLLTCDLWADREWESERETKCCVVCSFSSFPVMLRSCSWLFWVSSRIFCAFLTELSDSHDTTYTHFDIRSYQAQVQGPERSEVRICLSSAVGLRKMDTHRQNAGCLPPSSAETWICFVCRVVNTKSQNNFQASFTLFISSCVRD